MTDTYTDERVNQILDLVADIFGIPAGDFESVSLDLKQISIVQHLRNQSGDKFIIWNWDGKENKPVLDASGQSVLAQTTVIKNLQRKEDVD